MQTATQFDKLSSLTGIILASQFQISYRLKYIPNFRDIAIFITINVITTLISHLIIDANLLIIFTFGIVISYFLLRLLSKIFLDLLKDDYHGYIVEYVNLLDNWKFKNKKDLCVVGASNQMILQSLYRLQDSDDYNFHLPIVEMAVIRTYRKLDCLDYKRSILNGEFYPIPFIPDRLLE